MSWQPAPLPSQTCHWYWNVIGVEPVHVPGLAVIVLPTAFVPDVVGCDAFEGATAARPVMAAAGPTATSAIAIATAPISTRRSLRSADRSPGNQVMTEPPRSRGSPQPPLAGGRRTATAEVLTKSSRRS